MDSILLEIGDFPVTVGIAALLGVTAIATVIVILLIGANRANNARLYEAAEAAKNALREGFQQQLADRDSRIAERDSRILDLDQRLYNERETRTTLQAEAAALKAQMTEKTKQSEENLARFLSAREQMTDEFKLIANTVLKSHGETFSKQNREQVDTLLKPLSDRIHEFQKGLTEDRAAMAQSIKFLLESNQQITTEATNLTRALKGNSQTQGAWGEMILSTILEQSGLREGEQFFTQQHHAAGDNSRLRTDVEILMPNGDRLVIDSKVSLTAFEAFTNSEDDNGRTSHLQAHVTSLRTHIKTLGSKDYQTHAKSSVDYVLMFVPIEAAFAVAIENDRNLVEFGIKNGVMLTTPTNLMTVLRTVRNIWDVEKRQQNAEEIAQRAGQLYDKVVGFLVNMDKLEQNLNRAQVSFSDAKGQLASGAGNVVRQIEMLRDLGAKTSKSLPAGWEGDGASQLALDSKTENSDL